MTPSPANSTPDIATTADALRAKVAAARKEGKIIGLVPTMGALHSGHVSLVEHCRRECGFTVVTIFVNPTQFAPGEDFERYPRTFEADCAALTAAGADLIFAPNTSAMYAPEHATTVEVAGPANRWEGECRPGHFAGVATVVLKLFNLAQPDRAYFGRKDFQQTCVVRRMVQDLDLPIHITVCPTIRESDGLAMSSRNVYLSADERVRALSISRGLKLAKELVAAGTTDVETLQTKMHELLTAANLNIDYVAIVDPLTLEPLTSVRGGAVALIAARVGSTRLIDNELLHAG